MVMQTCLNAALYLYCLSCYYRGADKSLARPTSRCILFDGGNISFDASLVIYIVIILISSFRRVQNVV